MSVGHKASRKFGGPEIYTVPNRALIAGLVDGNNTRKACCRKEEWAGSLKILWAVMDWRIGHCWHSSQLPNALDLPRRPEGAKGKEVYQHTCNSFSISCVLSELTFWLRTLGSTAAKTVHARSSTTVTMTTMLFREGILLVLSV